MHTMIVIGTRPEVIKVWPVVKELDKRGMEYTILTTGQHDVSGMMHELSMAGGYLMGESISGGGNRLSTVVETAMRRTAHFIDKLRPDLVMVQGDTASCLGGALAAFHAHVPLAHVEAGLRSGLWNNPFPEEMYRRMVDEMSTYLFAPTVGNVGNADNLVGRYKHVTGNTIADAVKAINPQRVHQANPYVLFTCHRRETTQDDAAYAAVLDAVDEIAQTMHVKALVPGDPAVAVHMGRYLRPCVERVSAMGYRAWLNLLVNARAVLTDSGGIVEECAVLGVPCVVCRDVTEREEAFGCGYITMPGIITSRLVADVQDMCNRANDTRPSSVFSDGHAAERIVDVLQRI